MLDNLKRWLGLEKHDKYVKDYFFRTNMIAGIYLSVSFIIIEIWMILRLTRQIIREERYSDLSNYFRNYYFYYFLLLGMAVIMLIFALRYIRGHTDNQKLGTVIKWLFVLTCFYFALRISLNDYAKGEQMLAFVTLEVFVVCVLIWRPVTGFLILTVTYLIYMYHVSRMVPVNVAYNALIKGTPVESGATLATKVNVFTMWLSTLIVCISNYNKTLDQARKDENLEKINSHLEKTSVTDELTGIHNMVYFRSEAEKLFNSDGADNDSFIILFMDIENFKSYNETYGFHKGNNLLRQVAVLIEDTFEGAVVSRFSDDHFVILTQNVNCLEKITFLSDEIKKLQGDVHLELKCGAYSPAEGEFDTSLACDRARFACNSIKKHYNCIYSIYDKTLEDKFQRKHYIVNNIDTAIENKYIKVFYQPVISAASNRICGLEALARWQDPDYGLLSPAHFIDTLEEYRQIHKLDRYMIEQVCLDYVHAKENGLAFVPVSINISRLDFELCDIVEYLNDTVEKYGVPKDYLDIEITESALTNQYEFLIAAISKLRSSGFSVWLDDFGSGYSSLNVLKDYTFDVMKIDMKFLSGFEENEKTKPILRNIVGLSRQLGMVPLSEGVETKEQYEFLREIGCNKVQGYLFCKPVTITELRAKIKDGELSVDEKYYV